jgi:hypothetical protein
MIGNRGTRGVMGTRDDWEQGIFGNKGFLGTGDMGDLYFLFE